MPFDAVVTLFVMVVVANVTIRWYLRDAPVTPDPWGPEIEQAIHAPEAQPICHHCLTPQAPTAWFCPECGNAVGPYNNWMPYVNVFSEGEILRAGVTNHFRPTPFIIAGFLLYSLGNYLIFAPVYWYYLFQNLRNQEKENERESTGDQDTDSIAPGPNE